MVHVIRDRSFWMGLFGVVVGCLLTEIVRTGPLEHVRADTPSTPAASVKSDSTSEGASHAQARTAPNRYIPFQAYLTDTEGRPVADNTYSIEFKLYESAEGGKAVWWEPHGAVPVAKGMVNVLLGSKNPDSFGDLTFSEAKYVGICVDCSDETGLELVPRQQIIPAIHAADAERAGQLVIPGTFEPAITVDTEGDVGVGTTSPQARLHATVDDFGSIPALMVSANSWLGNPARTAFEVQGGNSLDPKYFRIHTEAADYSALKADLDGAFSCDSLDVIGNTRVGEAEITSGVVTLTPRIEWNVPPGSYHPIETLTGTTNLYMIRVSRSQDGANYVSYLLLVSASHYVNSSTVVVVASAVSGGYVNYPHAEFREQDHKLEIRPNPWAFGNVDVRFSKIGL